MTIPKEIIQKLHEPLWLRGKDSDVEPALETLGVRRDSDFANFYRRFWGPFHSTHYGHELLDLVDQDESVVGVTQRAREASLLPDHHVAISTLLGMSLLVYKDATGEVFDVDLEGGEDLLASGELKPIFQSWNEFIIDFFS